MADIDDKSDDPGREAILLGGDERGMRFLTEDKNGDVVGGRMVPAPDGAPIPPGADLVALCPDWERGRPHVRMHTLYECPDRPGAARKGPARTPTAAYDRGWERIWGAKSAPKESN